MTHVIIENRPNGGGLSPCSGVAHWSCHAVVRCDVGHERCGQPLQANRRCRRVLLPSPAASAGPPTRCVFLRGDPLAKLHALECLPAVVCGFTGPTQVMSCPGGPSRISGSCPMGHPPCRRVPMARPSLRRGCFRRHIVGCDILLWSLAQIFMFCTLAHFGRVWVEVHRAAQKMSQFARRQPTDARRSRRAIGARAVPMVFVLLGPWAFQSECFAAMQVTSSVAMLSF